MAELINALKLSDTTHEYVTGNASTIYGSGPLTINDNWSDRWGGWIYANVGSSTSPAWTYVQSTHLFAATRTITQIDFQFYTLAHEYGDDTGWIGYNCYAQYTTDGGANWTNITGSVYYDFRTQYHGSLDSTLSTGHVTLTGLNLVGCNGIRVFAGSTNGNNKTVGSHTSEAYIYETQAWYELLGGYACCI